MLCIGLSDSNGKVIPSYTCGLIHECGLCYAQNNMRTLCNMFMKSWAILGFLRFIICSRHNISGDKCNCKFKNLCFNVWCVIKCEHHSTCLHFIHKHCPSYWWNLDFFDPLSLTQLIYFGYDQTFLKSG
jgi:succinate dehydrogenase/fumarate reductase-like Fe-S protein